MRIVYHTRNPLYNNAPDRQQMRGMFAKYVLVTRENIRVITLQETCQEVTIIKSFRIDFIKYFLKY
jgi:hypothetical protein